MADRDLDPVISSCFFNPVRSNRHMRRSSNTSYFTCRLSTVDMPVKGLNGPVELCKVEKEAIECASSNRPIVAFLCKPNPIAGYYRTLSVGG
jgi:hypothetical protein